jgi:hypothetical protein
MASSDVDGLCEAAAEEIQADMRLKASFATNEERENYINELCERKAKEVLAALYDNWTEQDLMSCAETIRVWSG